MAETKSKHTPGPCLTERCGCSYDVGERIVYCPTHAAALEMRVLLYRLTNAEQAEREKPSYNFTGSNWYRKQMDAARALLARIEGKR